MVRVTTVLFRVPVIKFRKGGFSHSGGSSTAVPTVPGSGTSSAAFAAQGQRATVSTISDVDLPPRYRRAPLSQQEIDMINGGGVI